MISAARKEELRRRFPGSLRENVPLASKTAYRVGGPAACLLEPRSLAELESVLRTLAELELGFMVLGGGWNTLISDAGIQDRAVISLAQGFAGLEILGRDQWAAMLRVEAGVRLSRLIQQSAAEGFGGLEKMAGIPGSLGGAIAMNAGAYGTTIYDCLAAVQVMEAGRLQWLRASRLKPCYRNGGLMPGQVVVAAYFLLELKPAAAIAETLAEVGKLRGQRLPQGAHAGSVFKNPEDDYAGRLLEEAGCKGLGCGGARVSGEHANVIVAGSEARAADIMTLIETMRQRVQDRFGIRLETEIRIY